MNKQKLLPSLISLCMASAVSMAANAQSISNPGFESSFEGWTDTDPSAISGVANSGSKSAKISGSAGRVDQYVAVQANTQYRLQAYVRGHGRIGANTGTAVHDVAVDSSSWTLATVEFNSGSATEVEIFAKYDGGEGRFDDFSLVALGGTTPSPSPAPTPAPTPAPSGCTSYNNLTIAQASDDGSHDGHGPANAIDNDTSNESRWSSQGDGKVLSLELGSNATVRRVLTSWYKGTQRTAYYDIEASVDGANWGSVVANGQSSSSQWHSDDVDNVEARYLRIIGHGNSANNWNSLIEVDVLGCEGSAPAPTPTPTPTATPEPTPTPNPTPTPTPPPSNAQYPSDLMDNYNQWKITYPDGVEDKTLYQESNEYFYVNDEGNGIVFFAPIRSSNGTTPNSSYIRSELREREEDGSKDIYWTTDGKHVVYSKQAITHLPIVKSHLVATQIHGNKAAGIDDALVLRLENSHLFLSFNGGKLRDDLTIKTDYHLGTTHEVMFEVIDGKHYVYYSEDGNLAQAYANGDAAQYLVKDGSNNYVMDLSYGESYFKIGNYTQSNPDREGDYTDAPDNYGEVIVYDFWVHHEN